MDDLDVLSVVEIERLVAKAKGSERRALLDALEGDRRLGVAGLVERFRRVEQRMDWKRRESLSLLKLERKLWDEGFTLVAGVDEVGRGALAGPLLAAAVILRRNGRLGDLRECKQVPPQKREELYDRVLDGAVTWNIAAVEPQDIDRMGLHKANIEALREAVLGLSPAPDFVLSDCFRLPDMPVPSLGIVGGDATSLSVAAASIVAKVTRDRLMREYHPMYPAYGFDRHVGYSTAEHMDAVRRHGPCPIHRRSFAPCSGQLGLDLEDRDSQEADPEEHDPQKQDPEEAF